MGSNGGRNEDLIGVGMTGRTLRSSHRMKGAVKVEVVRSGLPMKTRRGEDDEERP
jgi:hypothetical protein